MTDTMTQPARHAMTLPSFRLTPRAREDVTHIWQRVANDSEVAADRLILQLFGRFELVAMRPDMMPARPEIAQNAHVIVQGRYVTIYEPTHYGVLIIAVVHVLRDPSLWLD